MFNGPCLVAKKYGDMKMVMKEEKEKLVYCWQRRKMAESNKKELKDEEG